MSKVSTRTLTIAPNALLCDLQPVTIENIQRFEEVEETAQFHPQDSLFTDEGVIICTENLTSDQIKRCKQLIQKYTDLFEHAATI